MSKQDSAAKIGVLWRGRADAPVPTGVEGPLSRVFAEIESRGVRAVPVVFDEAIVENVREQLLGLDGVLVWVDPLDRGRDRSVLDALLRDVATRGVWVSAHPDTILKMGTKDVLVRTREMEWGSETHLYATIEELAEQLPALLRTGPRVLKQHRGNGGNGVWKVELSRDATPADSARVQVLHALRGSRIEEMGFNELIDRFRAYFANGGRMIDQPYQERLGEGMIRCYQAGDRVAGFGHQFVTALLPPPPGTIESPAPPPRYYFGPDKPDFQALKHRLESGWIEEMQRLCGVDSDSLPALWDADFLLGPKSAAGEDSYVLCEINISAVSPFPEEAAAPLAEAAIAGVLRARERRGQAAATMNQGADK